MSDIKTKPSSKEYRTGWERIWGKKTPKDLETLIKELPQERQDKITKRATELLQELKFL